MPAVFHWPAPVSEYVAPAPEVIHSPAPVSEYVATAPEVIHSSASVVKYISPAPAVFSRAWWSATSRTRRFSPRTEFNSVSWRCCFRVFFLVVFKGLSQDSSSALRGADPAGGPQGLVPGQGSTALRDVDFGVIARRPTTKLWMRKDGVDRLPVYAVALPLPPALQPRGSQGIACPLVCGELLSPDDTPAQGRLEDDHILDVVVSRGRGGEG